MPVDLFGRSVTSNSQRVVSGGVTLNQVNNLFLRRDDLNAPLTNFQLIEAAKKLEIENFRGVFLRDKLPKNPRINECEILNIDDSTGQDPHWVCWLKNGTNTLCFDSYGLQPPEELIKYLGSSVYYNTERIQPDGHLCLFILKKLNDDQCYFSFQKRFSYSFYLVFHCQIQFLFSFSF
jgi:hypothetical protein